MSRAGARRWTFAKDDLSPLTFDPKTMRYLCLGVDRRWNTQRGIVVFLKRTSRTKVCRLLPDATWTGLVGGIGKAVDAVGMGRSLHEWGERPLEQWESAVRARMAGRLEEHHPRGPTVSQPCRSRLRGMTRLPRQHGEGATAEATKPSSSDSSVVEISSGSNSSSSTSSSRERFAYTHDDVCQQVCRSV